MTKILGVLVAVLVACVLAVTAALAEEHGNWQQIENNPNCVVWNDFPQTNDKVTWNGACANGKAQGQGTQVWRYLNKGDWKEDKYTGEMKDGMENGRGVYIATNGDRYDGEWKDGKQHGRGVSVWGPSSEGAGDRYEGGFKDDKAHGRGIYEWVGGDRYEGDWKDGKEHGRGNYVWADGESYEGDWKDGKEHGRGVYVWADGDECEGDWREGKLLGMGEALLAGQWRKVWSCWWLIW